MNDHVVLAARLFAAFESGDLDAARDLCAPGFRGTQNGGPAMDLETLLKFSAAVSAAVEDFRYEAAVREATATGFVEEHAVRGTLPDGSQLDLAVCVVGDVRNGKISALREYLDSARAAGLLEAIRPAG
ncbi:MAG: nuclear transport factor 2 family protein [Sphingomonadaceae bacterium]|jgi:ketosteroid isomerase-like protein|nr:MAG: nuclear transport factor 2 family protein [Sphingomonadaceae bacterium]